MKETQIPEMRVLFKEKKGKKGDFNSFLKKHSKMNRLSKCSMSNPLKGPKMLAVWVFHANGAARPWFCAGS